MQLEGADLVLVGYGEVGTKSSPVRSKLTARLADALRALLDDRDIEGTVERGWARLYVRTPTPDAAARAAADCPGVVFARPAVECAATRTAIEEAVAGAAAAHTGGSFAVRARRARGDHPFSARDLERAGGDVVRVETDASVDLDDPAVTYRVEVRGDRAFVSVDSVPGPGGLPPGSDGRVVTLVSGGLDSPVAAWELLRRGAHVLPVYVSLGDYGGPDHEARAVESVRVVGRRVPALDTRVRVVDFGDVVADLVATVEDTRMLSLRRAMLAAADEVATREGAEALATGEVLGQKSSQTGPNLAVVGAAVGRQVHRPLLTWDKSRVVEAARDLGTFEVSTAQVGCDRIAPTHPETNASREAVRAAEPPQLVDRARALGRDARTVELPE